MRDREERESSDGRGGAGKTSLKRVGWVCGLSRRFDGVSQEGGGVSGGLGWVVSQERGGRKGALESVWGISQEGEGG